MQTLKVVLVGALLSIAAGCQSTDIRSEFTEEINTLRREKKQLSHQVEQAQNETKQLKQQLQTMSGISPEVRLENLYDIQSIKITRHTNLYDKDKDGKDEKLIVYIQPFDKDGDVIKATGVVDVQLWDLEKPNGQAMLGQWQVKPDELKKLWHAAMLTINYRLTFDVADIVDGSEQALTVKVTFTDYLTGKVFKEQKVIKP